VARVASKVMVTVAPTGRSKPDVVQSLPLFVKVGVSAPPVTLVTCRLVAFSRPVGSTSESTTSKAVVVPVLPTVDLEAHRVAGLRGHGHGR
jgi:hypothetical protein